MRSLVLLKPHIKTQMFTHKEKKKRVIKPQNIWLYNQTCSVYLTDLIINSFIETLTTRGKIVRNSCTYSNSQFIDVKKAVNCRFLLSRLLLFYPWCKIHHWSLKKKKTNLKDNSLFYFNSKRALIGFENTEREMMYLLKWKGDLGPQHDG